MSFFFADAKVMLAYGIAAPAHENNRQPYMMHIIVIIKNQILKPI